MSSAAEANEDEELSDYDFESGDEFSGFAEELDDEEAPELVEDEPKAKKAKKSKN